MYTSQHLGQYSFTIDSPGTSDNPAQGSDNIQSCNLNQSDYSNSAFYNVDLGPGSMRYCNGKNREIEKVKASTHL